MKSMINFGIDLGTSNSLIARFDKGSVEVFRNPNGFKETLASVVGYRNDRIMIGDVARTYLERDPRSVVSRFKRKMGTTESFRIKSLDATRTPVELSAEVLKELKGFVHTGESVRSAVITIPASFDTVQSTATKEAGMKAGFKNVVLLQEPIAASLAYANKEKNVDLRNSQWIVYDLGGGTFDVALVRIVEGELTVVDHEGDNYLGGGDFDAAIVEQVVVPELQRQGSFSDLLAQLKSESGSHNRLWYTLLKLAEDSKIELSSRTSSEIDLGRIQVTDDDGNTIESLITITRSDFEAILKDSVARTIDMMRAILTRNSLQPRDLAFILMVGGSTYIPYVRRRVEEVMGIPVNTGIDPTNAIAVGAAYFAGSKEDVPDSDSTTTSNKDGRTVRLRVSYNRNSQDAEESFVARVEGSAEGLSYRITRDDGAFDSGTKRVGTRIVEDLPLRAGAYNVFTLRITDEQGNLVNSGLDSIQIAQGRYSVAGQMLPEDICLVLDDLPAQDTKLKRLFAKNAVLPSSARSTAEVAKTIVKGSSDEIRITVVEGPDERHPSTNKPIGMLIIGGGQVTRDLIKGTDVDLEFVMSESRELTVSAFLNGTGQQFSQVFQPSARSVVVGLLAAEVVKLEETIQEESEDAEGLGKSDTVQALGKLLSETRDLMAEVAALEEDDVTDDKFKIEDRKRQLAQRLYDLTSGKRLESARSDYEKARSSAAQIVRDHGNDRERFVLEELLAKETGYQGATNPEKLKAAAQELDQLRFGILMRLPDFLQTIFKHQVGQRAALNDQTLARRLIDDGRRHIEAEDWDELRDVIGRLWDLMPSEQRATQEARLFTGLI